MFAVTGDDENNLPWILSKKDYNTRCRLFKIQGFFVHNYPEAEAQRSYAHALSRCLAIQRGMRLTTLSLCLRVIVNEKPLNLEKTTSSVLSVLLLIYAFKPRVFYSLKERERTAKRREISILVGEREQKGRQKGGRIKRG